MASVVEAPSRSSQSGTQPPGENMISALLGKKVTVRLNNNVDYTGKCFVLRVFLLKFCEAGVLVALDGFMNVALERAEEYINGAFQHNFGDVFVRGNNGNALFCLKNAVHFIFACC